MRMPLITLALFHHEGELAQQDEGLGLRGDCRASLGICSCAIGGGKKRLANDVKQSFDSTEVSNDLVPL